MDTERDQLADTLGLDASLGANADQVLALVATSEDAARAEEEKTLPTARSTGQAVDAVAVPANLPVAPVPPPEDDVRQLLPGVVSNVGLPGSGSRHDGPTAFMATRTSGGLTGTTTMTNTIDAAINGSVATLQVGRTVHSVVSDIATGATVFEESREYQIGGQIDVCPSIAGVVDASVTNSFNASTTTTAGPGGGVGSSATGSFTSTSAFQGQVDDQANLGAVSQDYKHDEMFKRTTAVSGGPATTDEGAFGVTATGVKNGVPATHAWSLSLGDWSAASGSSSLSGSATQKMLDSTAFSAALDYTTIDASFVAAQRRWRNGACVVVTSPTYNVETQPGGGGGDNIEEVAKGSTTQFQIGLRHRFGATLTASIAASLDSGQVSLSPDSIDKPPGTMTYVAPSEDGKDATVRFTSTSKQGIGILTLIFHTGAKELQVSISGSMTTTGLGVSYVTTLNAAKVVLTKQADGTYLGFGPVTTKITVKGLCPNPFNETGTLILRATRDVVTDPTLPQSWYVSMDSTTKILTSGTCLGQSLGSLLQSGANGFAGDFMKVLGVVTLSSGGDDRHIVQTTSVGPAKQALDAKVKGIVISESGQ